MKDYHNLNIQCEEWYLMWFWRILWSGGHTHVNIHMNLCYNRAVGLFIDISKSSYNLGLYDPVLRLKLYDMFHNSSWGLIDRRWIQLKTGRYVLKKFSFIILLIGYGFLNRVHMTVYDM